MKKLFILSALASVCVMSYGQGIQYTTPGCYMQPGDSSKGSFAPTDDYAAAAGASSPTDQNICCGAPMAFCNYGGSGTLFYWLPPPGPDSKPASCGICNPAGITAPANTKNN